MNRIPAIAALLAAPLLLHAAVEHLYLDLVDDDRDRTVPVKIYHDPGLDAATPVVLYSHGLGGTREGKAFLGEHWAEAGYIAVFLQHPGSDASVWRDAGRGERMDAMKSAASGGNFKLRIDDVSFVLDELERLNGGDGPLAGRLDLDRIAMTGHSFGAVTTQAAMGQLHGPDGGFSFRDDRLDCFIPMSPSASRQLPDDEAFGMIGAPVLCMTGTRDTSPIRPEVTAESRTHVFHALADGDKYQVVFQDGEHSLFSGKGKYEARQPALEKLTTAFLDAYLKDNEKALEWLQSAAPEQALFPGDTWNWK